MPDFTRIDNRRREIADALAKRLEVHLDARAVELQAAIQEVLHDATPGKGKLYATKFFTRGRGPDRKVIPYGRRVPHRASAPGDPPATDTGRLIASIAWRRKNADTRIVGTNVEYAFYLEFGTDRMKPRPFFRPGIDRFRKRKRRT